jgi:hypothetical protein
MLAANGEANDVLPWPAKPRGRVRPAKSCVTMISGPDRLGSARPFRQPRPPLCSNHIQVKAYIYITYIQII